MQNKCMKSDKKKRKLLAYNINKLYFMVKKKSIFSVKCI